MAIIYNSKDNIWYCTNAERLAADISSYPETSKFKETDTSNLYILFGGAWELDRNTLQQYNTSTPPTATPVTVDTTAGGTVLIAANLDRISVTLQNTGTQPCIVRIGGNPSTSAYNVVLNADTVTRGGNGGAITIIGYQGTIKGITEAASTVVAVYEEIGG